MQIEGMYGDGGNSGSQGTYTPKPSSSTTITGYRKTSGTISSKPVTSYVSKNAVSYGTGTGSGYASNTKTGSSYGSSGNASKQRITVRDKNKLKNNVININAYMIKLDKNLKELSSNLNAMMVGDKRDPYWNGDEAVKFYNSSIANLKNDIVDYVIARNELDNLAELYELVNSGYKK